MPRPQRKSFADPDEVRTFKRGHIDVVLLDEIAIAALAGPGDVLVSGTTHELSTDRACRWSLAANSNSKA